MNETDLKELIAQFLPSVEGKTGNALAAVLLFMAQQVEREATHRAYAIVMRATVEIDDRDRPRP
jgi:hypothetical protein